MTIYEYITQPSFPITLEGVIENIKDGLITLRSIESGRKIIIIPDDSENIEYYLKHVIFAGEELSEDEHTLYACRDEA